MFDYNALKAWPFPWLRADFVVGPEPFNLTYL
jgi:hypothetical protein